MEIRKEIPTWLINWVNKIYTLANTPAFIDDVFRDWAIYTDFVLTWNIITLVDAPTTTLYIDYTTWITNSNITSSVSLWDIKSKVWNLLWQKPTSVNFSNDIVKNEINTVAIDILRGNITNKLNQLNIKWVSLPFNETYNQFEVKASWMLSEELLMWDTTVLAWVSGMLSAWYCLIWWDIIQYTSRTDTQLNGLSGITINHKLWDKISQLYVLPTNLDNIIKVEQVFAWYTWTQYKEIGQEWLVSYKLINNRYLLINWIMEATQIKVSYKIKYTNLSLDSDICVLPDNYGLSVIAYIVAWNLAYDKWIPTAERLLNSWYMSLKNFYQYYNTEVKPRNTKLMPKPYKFTWA